MTSVGEEIFENRIRSLTEEYEELRILTKGRKHRRDFFCFLFLNPRVTAKLK